MNERGFINGQVIEYAIGPQEVAARLGISYQSVIRAYHRGEIPGAKLGKLYRFKWSLVAPLLEQRVGTQ